MLGAARPKSWVLFGNNNFYECVPCQGNPLGAGSFSPPSLCACGAKRSKTGLDPWRPCDAAADVTKNSSLIHLLIAADVHEDDLLFIFSKDHTAIRRYIKGKLTGHLVRQ